MRPFFLGLCIVLWFAASAVCTACAKLALSLLAPRAGSCALTLTSLQFLVAASASATACWIFNRRPPSAYRELALVAFAYTMGFLLLNQSLGRLQASFTETVRGLEPLTSFALARLFAARGSQLEPATAAALGAVLAGAALSVWAQPTFDVGGLFLGLLANCAFSSRALLVTLLQDAQKKTAAAEGVAGGGEIDSVGLFAAQHILGLMLLAPMAYANEGTQCLAELGVKRMALRSALWSASGFLCYNFLSLYVLLLLDAVAHSVCNTCRRAVTICAALVIFASPISIPSTIGIVLIIGGSVGYAVAKDQASRSAAARRGVELARVAENDAMTDSDVEKARLTADGVGNSPATSD